MSFRGIPRNQIPFVFGGSIHRWEDTWHETDHFEFTITGSRSCEECHKMLPKGTLISVGERQVIPDAPVPIEGVSIICWQCRDNVEGQTLKDFVADAFKYSKFEKIKTLKGYAEVPREERLQMYLAFNSSSTADPGDEVLSPKRLAFTGFDCITCGEFSAPDLKSRIDGKGGYIHQQLNLRVKFCVLGEDGKTEYGSFTGSKSKKYKEAKAAGCIVVNEKFIIDYEKKFDKSGETAAEYLIRKWKEHHRNKRAPPPTFSASMVDSEVTKESKNNTKKRSREEYETDAVSTENDNASASTITDKDEDIIFFPPPRKLLSQKELDQLDQQPRKKLQAIAKRYSVKQTLSSDALVKAIREAVVREKEDY